MTLSEAASVVVYVTQLRKGHLVGNRCSLKARRGKSCQVRATFRRLQFRAHTGPNAFKLNLRRLAPGNYTALIYATDSSSHRSHTIEVRFTIIRVASQHADFRSVGGSLEAVPPILMFF